MPISAMVIMMHVSIATAAITATCQSTNNGTRCDFSGTGTGNDLSTQILDKLNTYPSNLTINISSGNYMLAPIQISSHDNITLHLSANTTLTAVPQTDPAWKNRRSLITVQNCNNFIFSGDNASTSILDGQGAKWWVLPHPVRPDFTYFNTVNGLQIHDLTLRNSPKYNVEIEYSSNVSVQDITFDSPSTSPNTDGVNMTSDSGVKINNINVTNGDDCIAVNADAGATGKSDNIAFTNSICNYGHGVSIGSNVHNTVSNFTADHITLNQSANGLRIKTHCDSKDCTDTKKATIDGVTYSNITMNGVGKPIFYDLTFDNKGGKFSLVQIKNINYSNVTATNSGIPASLLCQKPNICSPIQFTNVSIDTGGQCQGVNGGNPKKPSACQFN